MKKRRILITALFWCVTTLLPAQEPEIGFKETWSADQKTLPAFQEVYIQTIDLKRMKVLYTDRDGKKTLDNMDNRMLQRMGYEIFRRFAQSLSSVARVNMDENEPPDLSARQALTISVELSGEFRAEEKGLLMSTILAKNRPDKSYEIPLAIEIRLTDASGGKTFLVLEDNQLFQATDTETPMGEYADWRAFEHLLDLWALRLKNLFVRYLTVSSPTTPPDTTGANSRDS